MNWKGFFKPSKMTSIALVLYTIYFISLHGPWAHILIDHVDLQLYIHVIIYWLLPITGIVLAYFSLRNMPKKEYSEEEEV